MSIKSAPYYWITCDGTTTDGGTCAASSVEGTEHSAWVDADQAWIMADSSGWLQRNGNHYCEGCAYTFLCSECGELSGKCAGHQGTQ